jgi:hypothetical protein
MGRRPVIALTAAGAVLVVAAGTVFAATSSGRPARPAAAGIARSHMSRTVTTVGPLRVTTVTPAPGTDAANGADEVRVTFSAPLAPGSPMRRLSPAAAAWTYLSYGSLVTVSP